MNKLLALTTAVAACVALALPASGGADATGTCPDQHMPVPAADQPSKDRNGNGVICRKVHIDENGVVLTGGPDDKLDDPALYVDDIV